MRRAIQYSYFTIDGTILYSAIKQSRHEPSLGLGAGEVARLYSISTNHLLSEPHLDGFIDFYTSIYLFLIRNMQFILFWLVILLQWGWGWISVFSVIILLTLSIDAIKSTSCIFFDFSSFNFRRSLNTVLFILKYKGMFPLCITLYLQYL